MAELASAAPTSGGVSTVMTGSQGRVQNLNFVTRLTQLYFWAYSYSSPKWRNLLAWIVGCTSRFFINLQIVSFWTCRCQHDWDHCRSCIRRLGCSCSNHGCCQNWHEWIFYNDGFKNLVSTVDGLAWGLSAKGLNLVAACMWLLC
jgi:hypothetical protein